MIKAVLFDLDGVLVTTDRYHYAAWKQLADAQGWQFDPELNQRLRGVPRMESLEIILAHNGIQATPEQKNAWMERKNGAYVQALANLGSSDVLPGAVELLAALRARGVKTGLCSSSKNANLVLERLGWHHWFDAIMAGHDIERHKPDPQIFTRCAERLGVPPFHCLVFEDAAAGVQAALAAHMRVIGIGTPARLPGACECAQTLAEVDPDALVVFGRKRFWPADPWRVIEDEVASGNAEAHEAVFALSNGFIGLRGTWEEEARPAGATSYPGMFINGICDYADYHYEVQFPNLAPRRHVILNLGDWRIFNLTVNGEAFDPQRGEIREYRRELDLHRGHVTRSLVWVSPKGAAVRIESTRLVSMNRRHVAAIRYAVTALTADTTVGVTSVMRATATSRPLPGEHTELLAQQASGAERLFHCRTRTDQRQVVMLFSHGAARSGAGAMETQSTQAPGEFAEQFTAHLRAGDTLTVEKIATFHTSVETAGDLAAAARAENAAAAQAGMGALLREQEKFWQTVWEQADVEIAGHPGDQQIVRFNLFHLNQSLPTDAYRSISANGQTGDHYWGSYFWDTELFMAPHFIYTRPESVRSLLAYRHGILDQARAYARANHGEGACFTWMTITGEDLLCAAEGPSSAIHHNCAIVRALDQYCRMTGDTAFLFVEGAEMLFETARFLVSIGQFSPRLDGQFCLFSVTGPDEYAVSVDNNCYTNVMAQWHLRFAVAVYERMAVEAPDALATLAQRLALGATEKDRWQRAAELMRVPFNDALGIHEQDARFLSRADLEMTKFPKFQDIQLSLPPAHLRRLPLVKQADVVLLMFTQGEQFSLPVKRANYEFYEPRTCHASSLSPGIHAIVAAEIGKLEEAYDYFRLAAYLDLYDLKANTYGGMHHACIGSTWMALVHGFAGVRDYADGLHLQPILPPGWSGYRFTIRYHGCRLAVAVSKNEVCYKLLEGAELRFHAADQRVALTTGASWSQPT